MIHLLNLIKYAIGAALIAWVAWLAFQSLGLVVKEPVEKIRVVIEFVKQYNLGQKTVIGGSVMLLGGVGLMGIRNNRLVGKISSLRSQIQKNDPEKSSSGLNRKGRVKK